MRMRAGLVIGGLLSLLLVCSAVLAGAGDVNGDGVVNVQDLLFVVQNIHAGSSFNAAADVNGDGVVNIFDLVDVAHDFGMTYGLAEPSYNASADSLVLYDNFNEYATSADMRNAYPVHSPDADTYATITPDGNGGKALRLSYGNNTTTAMIIGPEWVLRGVGTWNGTLPEVAAPYDHFFFTSEFRTTPGWDPTIGTYTGGIKGFMFWHTAGGNDGGRYEFGVNTIAGCSVWYSDARFLIGPSSNSCSGQDIYRTANGEPPHWSAYNDGKWHRFTIEIYTDNGTTYNSGHRGVRIWVDGALLEDSVDHVDPADMSQFYLPVDHWDVFGNGWLGSPAQNGNIDFDNWTAWIPKPDTTPPVISGSSPSSPLASGTTSTTMSVTTNENATCKYSTTANTAYANMANTFSNTGGTMHSTTVSGLSDGQSYNYYVKCQDTAGNNDTTDYPISFSVATSSGGGTGGGTSVQPFFVENFSEYTSTADLLSDPRGIYNSEYWNPQDIHLDKTTGYGTLTQSVRYTFENRTNSSSRCTDYMLGDNLVFPHTVTQVWVEWYARFPTDFTTVAPSSWGCQSNPDLKWLFGAPDVSSRFEAKIGQAGDNFAVGAPENEGIALYYNGPGKPSDPGLLVEPAPSSHAYYDGQWHRYRVFWKLGNGTGVVKFWIDNTLIFDRENFNTGPNTKIIGLALGRNLNQGPDHAMSYYWGQIKAWDQDPGW